MLTNVSKRIFLQDLVPILTKINAKAKLNSRFL